MCIVCVSGRKGGGWGEVGREEWKRKNGWDAERREVEARGCACLGFVGF